MTASNQVSLISRGPPGVSGFATVLRLGMMQGTDDVYALKTMQKAEAGPRGFRVSHCYCGGSSGSRRRRRRRNSSYSLIVAVVKLLILPYT